MIRWLLVLCLVIAAGADERADILQATHEKVTPDTEAVVMLQWPWAMVVFFQREAGWSSVLRYFPGEGWAQVYGCRGGPGNEMLVKLGVPRSSLLKLYPDRADMPKVTQAELDQYSLGPYYPFLSERPVTTADMRYKSWWELTLMRNEIFARHGRQFQDAALAAYFHPRYPRQKSSPLSELEQQNARAILAYQERQKLTGPHH